MNKLDTNLYGGFPFDLDDWRWQINPILDGLQALGRAIGPSCIVSGCTYTVLDGGNVGYVQQGWVLIDGELCWWPGGNGVGQIPLLTYFTVAQTLDPSGAETFQDGTVQNAYIKRQAQLVGGGVPVVPYTRLIGPSFGQSLTSQDDWHVVGVTGSAPFEVGWTNPPLLGLSAAYRKERSGMVRLRGVVQRNAGSTDLTPFYLPVGYRPAATIYGNIPSIVNPELQHCSVEITTAGGVFIYNDAIVGSQAVYDIGMLPTFEAI